MIKKLIQIVEEYEKKGIPEAVTIAGLLPFFIVGFTFAMLKLWYEAVKALAKK